MRSAMRARTVAFSLLAVAIWLAIPCRGAAVPLLAQNWRELSPGERYDTLRNYQQHERLPEDGRRDVERRYERWQQMSPDDRDRVRQNYQRMQQLPPHERDRLHRKYEKWRQQGHPPR